jgi:hypothetical protein
MVGRPGRPAQGTTFPAPGRGRTPVAPIGRPQRAGGDGAGQRRDRHGRRHLIPRISPLGVPVRGRVRRSRPREAARCVRRRRQC